MGKKRTAARRSGAERGEGSGGYLPASPPGFLIILSSNGPCPRFQRFGVLRRCIFRPDERHLPGESAPRNSDGAGRPLKAKAEGLASNRCDGLDWRDAPRDGNLEAREREAVFSEVPARELRHP